MTCPLLRCMRLTLLLRLYALHCFLGMYDMQLLMNCPLMHWMRMTLAAAASCAAMFLGMYDMAFIYTMPAAALLATDFSRCG